MGSAPTTRIVCFLSIIGIIIETLGGCGYTLVGGVTSSRTLSVPLAVVPFTNQTREPHLEAYVTAAVRQAILRTPPFRLVSDRAASRRLSGVIRGFRAVPVSFTTNDTVTQYRLEAEITLRLATTATDTVLLEQDIAVWAEYLVSEAGDVRANTVAKEAAIWRLTQQFADKCTALLTLALL